MLTIEHRDCTAAFPSGSGVGHGGAAGGGASLIESGVEEGRVAQCSEVGSQHWERRTQNRGGGEGVESDFSNNFATNNQLK